jgi:hypothetical protein
MEKERKIFEEIQKNIREDLEYVKSLFDFLIEKLAHESRESPDIRDFLYDTFLDKIYEIRSKLRDFERTVDIKNPDIYFLRPLAMMEVITNDLEKTVQIIIHTNTDLNTLQGELKRLINTFSMNVEDLMSNIRRELHDTHWKNVEKIKPINFIFRKRKKFVNAIDELKKAENSINDEEWEDVLNHLRTAIELVIKEKFGFKKINRMIDFLKNADEFDLGLPSYSLIYEFYNEGSKRLHGGLVHTPFESKEALRTVNNFIQELNITEIDKKKIEEFKRKYTSVK